MQAGCCREIEGLDSFEDKFPYAILRQVMPVHNPRTVLRRTARVRAHANLRMG